MRVFVKINGFNDYVNGQGFCCADKSNLMRAGAIGNGADNPEKLQYYYHSDHLGSTSLITDLDGNVVQHVEYVPFGEVFIEERNNTWNTPYKFNAKELDEETGLFYYGARYYEPRASVWLSADQLQEKYPGVSTYCYTTANPINLTDPTGMWIPDGKGNLEAEKGDDFKTLKSYLSTIYGGEDKLLQEDWDALSTQVNSLISDSEGGDISGKIITSDMGLFNNLVGTYLSTKANSEPSWGFPTQLDGIPNLCSPTTFNRVDKAMEFVYGKDILGGINGQLYQQWNAYEGVKGTKYGEEMIPAMGYGVSVSEQDILDGYLKTGAILRMTQSPGPSGTKVSWHSVIFLNYTYDNDGNIKGMRYWQQKSSIGYINSIDFSYNNNGKYSFSKGYKPKLGANFK